MVWPTGTYEVLYKETGARTYTTADGYINQQSRTRYLKSNWYKNGDSLELQNFATIKGTMVGGAVSLIRIHFDNDIATPGLEGQTTYAETTWSSTDGIHSHDELCSPDGNPLGDFGQYASRVSLSDLTQRSLQLEVPTENGDSDGEMELFLNEGGGYELVLADSYGTRWQVVESGSWQIDGPALRFFSGRVEREGDRAFVTFDRDLRVKGIFGEYVWLRLRNKQVRATFDPSKYMVDDLTFNFQ